MNRSLKAFGALLVVLGAVLGVAQLGSVEQLVAQRDTSASVAAETDAYLSIQNEYSSREISNYDCFWFICYTNEQPRTVATLENRYVTDYTTVSAEVTAIAGASDDTLVVSGSPASLTQGESGEVVLSCSDTVTDAGTADVTLQIAVSDPIYIYEETTIRDVSYDCDPNP
ncbi:MULTISPECIES: hypothetical protein [Natrinema]|uniref:Uncharacterized protein n=1 Tax=Natrinema gari JCM 14663 TaxID=1230459 RepID=L9ZBL0_9EURY|nr:MULTISPECIES: hypothetical protein [Natrinema]AFO56154.1 hypothetical protein NJ7G_0904 [Natrinema sp. J7-2]ELY83870.1 hypothetical protein C486_01534 [Natrinema gari JCM 14663]